MPHLHKALTLYANFMKPLLLLISVFYLTGCNEATKSNQKSSDTHIYQKTNYSNGQLKEVTSFNQDSVKDGLTIFYDSLGKIDSTENYLIGKLNSKTFYGLDRKIEYHFQDDTLYSLKLFDTLGKLNYQSPIDPTLVKKPYVKLLSGRSYLPKDVIDTIVIITKGIPPYNRVISFIGTTTQTKISDSSFIISSSSKMIRKYKFITVIISYINDIEDELKKPVIVDSTFILLKSAYNIGIANSGAGH